MMRLWKTIVWLVLLLAAPGALAQPSGDRLPLLRPLVLRVPEAAQPVRLAGVRIDVVVVGRWAKSTIELSFRNPNARVLEGELQFPLLDGQQVDTFALDFDGKWRTAVPVEKIRGREIFEEVTRARVDPALLEATRGNQYKLRVYPIPAQGERRVALTISERLPEQRDGSALLRLPLHFAGRLDSFDLRLQVAGIRAENVRTLRGLADGRWEDRDGGAVLEMHHRDYQPEKLAEVRLPAQRGTVTAVEEFEGQRYFYVELPARRFAPASRPTPTQLALVWDASGSGAQREHGREFALLDAYFKAIGNTSVRLTLARDVGEDGGRFVIQRGDWSALRAVLESVAYDGATNLAAFRPTASADAVLLFSDGLGNFSATTMPTFDVPLLAVNAAVAADAERLRHAAEASGGVFVDLLKVSTQTAALALRSIAPRLIGWHSNGARELVATPVDPESGRWALAGILSEPTATLELDWQRPRGGVEHQSMPVRGERLATTAFAAQAWARLRINRLLPERNVHRAEIVRLGKAFHLITPGTSLIVLDRVEDYVRYEIVPPAELRTDYERLAAARRRQADSDRTRHVEDIVRRFADKQRWWERDFPKGDRPQAQTGPKSMAGSGVLSEVLSSGDRRAAAVPSAMSPLPAPAAAPAAVRHETAKLATARSDGEAATVAAIQLRKWLPDAPYVDRLRRASNEQLYRVYLDERSGYLNSTAFFLDVADIFFERGFPEKAIRILSNLAEMDLENRHVLRILAYRLLQAKHADLAVPVLQQVLDLAPDEPQSWRDLGLAQADNGARQQAVESLYQVVTRPWHNRFPDIELIALAEMNALIATSPEKLDTSAIDPRLLRNLPLDLRVVLAWDADNTDIDLWVTDPNGERSFYGNRLSYQGGAMSRDFTGGYGPEEYSLKQAKPGRYVVQAQFYGHRQQVVSGATTLGLRLYTGFGTVKAKEERLTLRLKGQGEVVTVGEFVVGEK